MLGADLDRADEDGATPSCIAAQEGQVACLRALGALGADLDAATKDGATPACIAAKVRDPGFDTGPVALAGGPGYDTG